MLTQLTQKSAVKKAMNTMQRHFAMGAVIKKCNLGSQAGAVSHNLIVREDLGIWRAKHQEGDNHFWCPFGILPLSVKDNQNMTVQLNPPIGPESRATSTLLATDQQGKCFVCHTGRIGGGRVGVGKTKFLEWFGQPTTEILRPGKKPVEALVLAEIDSPRLGALLARYVKSVADFKEGHKPAIPFVGSPQSNKSTYEFSGTKNIPAKDSYVAQCDHGLIHRALHDLIARSGKKVWRDQQRDLMVGPKKTPEVEFEIKPSTNTQSIYTAIGQLKLHGVYLRPERSVLVVPSGLSKSATAKICSLGIEVLTYSMDDSKIKFNGLSRIIPGTRNTISLHTQS
ncbi:hypothetical protein COB72_00360 [bacterium]|nr:MAG: hypothetical protein COB72_00360 [bacterium]